MASDTSESEIPLIRPGFPNSTLSLCKTTWQMGRAYYGKEANSGNEVLRTARRLVG